MYCSTHYRRLREHGSLDKPPSRFPSAIERFWNNVDRDGAGGCWIWTAFRDDDGYGRFRWGRRHGGAHRFSYEIHLGAIPDRMVVMHSCDVPACVNPAHLRLGTNHDNAVDSARKARRPRGSANHAAKLTEGQVLNLRSEHAAGGVTQQELADRYKISRALVSNIVNRKAWRHI